MPTSKPTFIKRTVKRTSRKRWAREKVHILNPSDEEYFLKLLLLLSCPCKNSELAHVGIKCNYSPDTMLARLKRGDSIYIHIGINICYMCELDKSLLGNVYSNRPATQLLGGIKKRDELTKNINKCIGEKYKDSFGFVKFFPENGKPAGRSIQLGDGSIRRLYNDVNREVTKLRKTIRQIENGVPYRSED